MRIDLALAALFPEFSRRRVRRLLDQGGVFRNQQRVRIASKTVLRGDELVIYISGENSGITGAGGATEQSKSKKLPVWQLKAEDVLFADNDLLIINKPAGLPSQATLDQSVRHALKVVQDYLKANGRNGNAAILTHRLDKETSGALVFALNRHASTHMLQLFREKKVRKEYLAICYGLADKASWSVQDHLSSLSEGKGFVRSVRAGGKSARTDFRVLAVHQEFGISLIACHPSTGRSHQIRVHLANSGLPIVGDKRYGTEHNGHAEVIKHSARRHMLHARALEFQQPRGDNPLRIECLATDEFLELLALFHKELPKAF